MFSASAWLPARKAISSFCLPFFSKTELGRGGESEKPPAYIRKKYFNPKGGITFGPFTQLMEEIGSTKESEQARQLKIPTGDRTPRYPHVQIN